MARLATIALLFAACFAPETRDCTLKCTGPTDCGDGQQCGSDGLCAAPAVAGHCATMPVPPSPSDNVELQLAIKGPGDVMVAGVGTCSSSDPQTMGTCTWQVPARVVRQLDAVVTSSHHGFDGWTAGCVGQDPTCMLMPVMPLTQVGARFH